MIRIFELRFLGVLGVMVVLGGPPLHAQEPTLAAAEMPQVEESYDVVGLVTTGLVRTNREWLSSYLDYEFPVRMARSEGLRVARKLMTTGAFTDVKAAFEAAPDAPGRHYLHVHLEEKWTTIPVVRGVYGGGTPLRVLGLYDIHALGRLLTLGGEMRKYGDAPPGFVLYGRDPRSQGGRYYLGAEFWRDFRRRQLYDRDGASLGAISTNTTISRLRFLTPLNFDPDVTRDYRWKYGLELEVLQEAPSVFDPDPAAAPTPPADLVLADGKRQQSKVLPTLLYDDIDVATLSYEGLRFKLRAGPTYGEKRTHASVEAEAFAYGLWPKDINLAAHALIGQTTLNSLQNLYFLGGLDSVRGLPDGAIYGTRAAYVNVEARHLSYKAKYVWLQSVAFYDAGAAAQDWSDLGRAARSAVGVGVRLAVPQIYRMIFRIDYAWAVDGSGTQGITAGMNQFFDPYTPL